MEIRKTTMADLDSALDLYAKARQFMKEHGNPTQWGDHHPPKEQIIDDIQKGQSYLCIENEQPLGIFFFSMGPEPDYAQIWDGEWLNDRPYGVMHRVASPGIRKGTASFCVNWCFKESGGNLRIDTHQDNLPMQNMLKKNGFLYCGIIHIRNGEERIAFQKARAAL
ncbi:MAG: GNAT family N-acetyltransferase [Lachnospiraceae bacterium]|nr:GNAT family N-acetyltransferase [Lachnospiraceae bacterium]